MFEAVLLYTIKCIVTCNKPQNIFKLITRESIIVSTIMVTHFDKLDMYPFRATRDCLAEKIGCNFTLFRWKKTFHYKV